MSPINKRLQGAALLTALFIMTLVAIVATAMSTKVQVDIYRTRLIILHDKLYLASQAVTLWALGELNDNKNRFAKIDKQGMVSQYPQKMETIYPSVVIHGGLYDLQAKYNLNNLANKKAILGFVNFLDATVQQIPKNEKINLALALNDWLSPYDVLNSKDLNLSYYLSQYPAYQPSHQLMASSSELRLVKEVSAQTYLAVEPFITALPEPTPLNINTASKQALMSLSNALNEDKVEELISARSENGIKDIKKISELLKKMNIAEEQITLNSIYFLSVAHTSSDNFNFTVYTLLKRSRDKKGKISVNVLRASFNAF
ncbi:MAG: type II secretion system minor pseudopilin GspK [Legionella sp.]|nr:type II secretion system minor pseudopilin GspK [Legionella sp.]